MLIMLALPVRSPYPLIQPCTWYAPASIAESAEEAAAFFQSKGLTIACAAEEESVPVDRADLIRPLFLLIGGEKRGITRSFLRQADLRLEIPYGREFRQSLGVTAAAAILGYEVMRQRGRRDEG